MEFVKKPKSDEGITNRSSKQLIERIVEQNQGLQEDYIQYTMNNEDYDEEIRQLELNRKSEITLYYKAMNEVKDFTFVIRTLIIKMYQPYLAKNDINDLAEDFLKLSTNLVVQDQVFKILLCLCRVESYLMDKELRQKYVMMKDYLPQDFGIDPYLTLNDESPIIEEVAKKYPHEDDKSQSFVINRYNASIHSDNSFDNNIRVSSYQDELQNVGLSEE